jgi:enoyl-CoA hydratase/carnithine racemase
MGQELAVEQAALSLATGSDGVAWLVFDNHGDRPNLLSAGVMRRLDELLGEVEAGARAGGIRVLVVRSGKDGSFIAGADVRDQGDRTTPPRAKRAPAPASRSSCGSTACRCRWSRRWTACAWVAARS